MRGDPVTTAWFWEVTEPLLAEDGVEQGTVMQYPCLRARGEFFAMPHFQTGDLVVKLPATRVAELIASGEGQPFGPGEKVFKEWVLVVGRDEDRWRSLLDEARAFVTR